MRVICTEDFLVGFGYINSETKQLVIVPNIEDSTKFDSAFSDELSYYLFKFRSAFPNKLFSTSEVSEKILNKPLRNVWTIPLTSAERVEIL